VRLAAALAPDGLVMLGAGETTVGQTDTLVPEKGGTGFHHLAIGMPVERRAAAAPAAPGMAGRFGLAGSR
jgi:chemotaxis protein methyltransferase CheR